MSSTGNGQTLEQGSWGNIELKNGKKMGRMDRGRGNVGNRQAGRKVEDRKAPKKETSHEAHNLKEDRADGQKKGRGAQERTAVDRD